MALNYYINQKGEIPNTALSMTDGGALERASRFHQTIPGYAPTPLVSLDHLAQRLGVAQVLFVSLVAHLLLSQRDIVIRRPCRYNPHTKIIFAQCVL